MRFAMTARTIARQRAAGQEMNEMTEKNFDKVTRYREDGEEAMEKMIQKMDKLEVKERDKSDDLKHVERRWGGKV